MDNNELNNNVQNDFKDQIMMGDTQTMPNVNQGTQPNAVNMNQGINTVIQNNINATQNIPTQEPSNDDTIFSDMESKMDEPVPTVQPTPESSIPTTQKDKKGKGSTIIIILLILTVLGLAGYIAYDKFIAKDTATKIEDTTKKETKEVKKPMLKDSNLDVVYSDIDEMHEGKTKKVPYVNIDSKYAEEINDELKTMVNKGLDGQIANTAYGIDYQYFINDEVVSIKFTWETESGNMTYSKIYNINQYTGNKVTDDEILNKINIEKSDLGNKLVESYKTARPLDTLDNNSDALVKDCYQKDIDALTDSKIKGMYLSTNNELNVLFDVNYIAGSGIGEAILNVNANKIYLNPYKMQ